jgi:hypothetical protein
MSSVVISGDTSGAITIAAPAVAGTNTITLPASTGTMLTTASSNVVTATMLSSGAVGTGVGFVRTVVYSSTTNGYTIWQGPDGTKLCMCWGYTPFTTGTGFANVTFPVTYTSAPMVNASVFRGTTLAGYLMSTQIGNVSTTTAQILGNYTTGGSVLLLSSNESAAWQAFGQI